MDYKITKNGKEVTITETASGIGLRFTEGEALQGYTSSILLPDFSILETEEGVKRMNEISSALAKYASTQFPKEFQPLNNPQDNE